MNRLLLQTLCLGILSTIFFIALIFISAGTLNYWQGWLYVLVVVIELTAITWYLAVHDSALLQRRMRMGAEKEQTQKLIVILGMPLLFSAFVLPALDYRFGWSPVPWYVSIVGALLVFLGLYIYYLVVRVNSFAAANITVEQGQRVISTGPYKVIRHPMYAGAILFGIGTPLALGSWWSLFLIAPIFLLIFTLRIVDEEKVLVHELAGYTEYQKNVRWRLIPGIF
jgi:protein-S-isoprenylcysteine O-methyltransferase Ste14